VRPPRAEPWWAGIVTAVTPEGVVLGAHPNGRADNEVASFNSGEAFAVSAAPATVDRGQAIRSVLRNAIARIRAQGAAGSFGRDRCCCFGVDAMDDWIEQMSGVAFFCPPCQAKDGRGWRSAQIVAQACVDRSRAAAAALREYQPSVPASARPSLEAAAKHYDRVVERLSSAKYREFIGDLGQQKAHAESVLVPVREDLAAAADELERALWACAPGAPDRTRLADLARQGHQPQDPFSLAMQAVAAAFGREVEYEAVLALSANCFAPDIRPDEDCRATWCLRGRGQCLDLVAERLGLSVRPLGCFCPRERGQDASRSPRFGRRSPAARSSSPTRAGSATSCSGES
jgi:hypothetical protein